MIWLFSLGIITLAVYHEGFRKVLLYCAVIAGALFGLAMLVAMGQK
jgi:hypothetical protein